MRPAGIVIGLAMLAAAIEAHAVQSRSGAVALGRTYLLTPLSSGGASMVPPWLRFHIPLTREFGGYDCSDDCSGLAAGYRWAEVHSITDESDCPLRGGAISFHEGCLVYVEDPSRGADEDDEGNDID